MANEITRTSVTETVPAEHIPDFVQKHRYAPSLMGNIAWIEQVPPGSGSPFRWPRHNVLTPNAGSKTEATASFSNFEHTTDEESCSAGVVGVALDVSREAQYDSRAGLPASMIEEGLRAMQNRLEADALATITGATSTGGAVGDILTIARYAAGLARFELTNPSDPNVAVIMAPVQWADLLADIALTASAPISAANFTELNAVVPGFKGRFLGANVFVTSNVATETTGRNAVITGVGKGVSGLGIAVWQPTIAELDPAPIRYADVWVLHARYGVCLTMNGGADPARNVTEMISRA